MPPCKKKLVVSPTRGAKFIATVLEFYSKRGDRDWSTIDKGDHIGIWVAFKKVR